MIEKLKRYIREEDGIKISCPPDNVHIISKINELVDAVNELQTRPENVQTDAESRPVNVQKEALTMALEALHAIAHWGPWKDDREEYAEKAHKKICELLSKGGDNDDK